MNAPMMPMSLTPQPKRERKKKTPSSASRSEEGSTDNTSEGKHSTCSIIDQLDALKPVTTPRPDGAGEIHSIPQQMQDAKRWLLWLSVPNKDPSKKRGKVPCWTDLTKRCGALDGQRDQRKLALYPDAVEALEEAQKRAIPGVKEEWKGGYYAGLGFALGLSSEAGKVWQGVDLDGVRDPVTGAVESWAEAILAHARQLGAYIEVSPSGKGFHIHGLGAPLQTLGPNKTGVEGYSEGRYFTFTGNGEPRGPTAPLPDLAPLMPALLAQHGTPAEEPGQAKKRKKASQKAQAPRPTGEAPILWAGERKALHDRILPKLDPATMGRETWIKTGMAIHNASGGCEEGFVIWDTWCSSDTQRGEAGYDAESCEKAWASFGKDNGKTPVTIATLEVMAKNAEKARQKEKQKASEGGAQGAGQHKRRVFSFSDAVAQEPIAQLVQGVLPRSGLVVFGGPPKSGKSFGLADLFASVARGKEEWFGREIMEAGLVLLYAFEGSISMRAKAYAKHHKIERIDNLLITTKRFDLRDPEAVKRELEFVKALEQEHAQRIVAVGIDTLARAMAGGNENGPEDMGAAVAGAEAFCGDGERVVVVVHHTGKDEAKGLRGHSSLLGALDVELRFSTLKDGTRRMVVAESRDGEEGALGAFHLPMVRLGVDPRSRRGEEMTSCVVVPTMDTGPDEVERTPQGVRQKAIWLAFLELERVTPHVKREALIAAVRKAAPAKDENGNYSQTLEAMVTSNKWFAQVQKPGGVYLVRVGK